LPKEVRITVRLPKDLGEAIKEKAKRESSTAADVIREALTDTALLGKVDAAIDAAYGKQSRKKADYKGKADRCFDPRAHNVLRVDKYDYEGMAHRIICNVGASLVDAEGKPVRRIRSFIPPLVRK